MLEGRDRGRWREKNGANFSRTIENISGYLLQIFMITQYVDPETETAPSAYVVIIHSTS